MNEKNRRMEMAGLLFTAAHIREVKNNIGGVIWSLEVYACKLNLVKRIIAKKFGMDISDITFGLNLIWEVGANASDIVELIIECKKHIRPPYCRVKQLETVGDIMMYFGLYMPKPQSKLKERF